MLPSGSIHGQKHRVRVISRPRQNFPVVKADRSGGQVPLSNYCRRVSAGLQCLCDRPLAGGKAIAIPHEAISVAVFAGQNRCSGWSADGIATKRIHEDRALLGQPIDVGRRSHLRQRSAIGRDGLDGMVIREDE